MPLADLKNAAATKEPPDVVLSSSNILGNFIELVVGFVDCFDWPAKGRGQYRHSTRDRNNRLHFMERWGREELLCIIFSLKSQLARRMSVLCAYSHPECTETSQLFSVAQQWIISVFLNISVKVSKKTPILLDWFEIFLLQFLMVSYRKWKYLIHRAT